MTLNLNKNYGSLLLLTVLFAPIVLPILAIYLLYKAVVFIKSHLGNLFSDAKYNRKHKTKNGVSIFTKEETDIHFGRK